MRPAEPSDAAAVADLLEQLGHPSTEEQVSTRLALLAESPDHPVLVAELELPTGERHVAGVLALELGRFLHRDERAGQITALVSDRRFRHRGVARALLESAERIARRSGCALLYARSTIGRDDAHGFYRAMGFEETHLSFDKEI